MTPDSPSNSKSPRTYAEEVEMVFSAIDCVLNRELAIYCSSELTSGLRIYEALRLHHLKTAAELKQKMGKVWADVFSVNINAANEFAKLVRGSVSDNTIVITPAPFTAPGWSQPEYLAFWETLIRTRIESVWFNREWQFSNGCTFEFAVAQDAGLPTFNHDGKSLDRAAGIAAIESAIQQLEAKGFDIAKLQENLGKLSAPRLVPTGASNIRR